ncbi:STAS domain-containing protein [Streptomyces sp. NPDC053076]|uniref:STAS domain-containing protein n=2 Tax=unclassified Streptomyces TaxID=2593676 RepID=UPI0037CF1FC5
MRERPMHDPAHRAQPRRTASRPFGAPDKPGRPLLPGQATATYAPSGDRIRVTVRGELDLDSGNQLRGDLHQALAASSSGLDLDLSRLDFCDCAGLNVLLELRQRALSQTKTVVMCAAGPAIDRLIDLMGFEGVFAPPGPRCGDPLPPEQATAPPRRRQKFPSARHDVAEPGDATTLRGSERCPHPHGDQHPRCQGRAAR